MEYPQPSLHEPQPLDFKVIPLHVAGGAPREPFTMVPNEVGETILGTLGTAAFGVYWHLARRSNAEGQCWPSLEEIGESVCLSRMHVTRMLKDLEAGGWVTREKRNNRFGMATSTLYVLPHLCERSPVTEREHVVNMEGPSMLHEQEPNKNQRVNDPLSPPRRGRVSKPLVLIPDDFDLTEERRAYALEAGLLAHEVERVFGKFCRYWRSEGKKKRDWDLTWENWVDRDAKDRRVPSPRSGAPPSRNGWVNPFTELREREEAARARDESTIETLFRVKERS